MKHKILIFHQVFIYLKSHDRNQIRDSLFSPSVMRKGEELWVENDVEETKDFSLSYRSSRW